MAEVVAGNLEAQEAWNGVLFDRFVQFRHLVADNLACHGAEATRRHPPAPGDRVLDVGCGFGDSTQLLAQLVGPAGSAVGVDLAPRFVEAACADAAGVANVGFVACDVQAGVPEGPFDYVFSRFGVMFFENPVAALRNLHGALRPGGRACFTVWRRRYDNPWIHRAETLVKPYLPDPDESESDEPRCGPGPFSMADADTASGQLRSAGFDEITLERLDLPVRFGATLDEAVELNLALGPAAEALRLAGDEGERVRPQLEELLRGGLAEFVQPDGSVQAMSSTWIVTANRPG